MIVERTPLRPPLSLIAAAFLVSLGLGSLGPGAIPAAAQATPAATLPADRIPCPIEPITPARFVAALDAAAVAAASPGPLERFTLDTLPAGEPADQAMTEAIIDTVEAVVNCRNAGDFPRIYALFSDHMIGQLFGGRETVPPEMVEHLQVGPRRVRPPFRVILVELANVSRLPDGRIGAVVVTANATHTFVDYLFLVVDDNGRWLIDQAVAVSAAPVAATPVP